MSNVKIIKSNAFGGVFSDSEDEMENKADIIEEEVYFKIQEKNEVILRKFRDFIDAPEFITSKGDPRTNIVDRYAMAGDKICSKMYFIPDNKINKFFKFLECCRRKNLRMMVYEKQGEYSGLMIDFDIYQFNNETYITEAFTNAMTNILSRFLNKYIKLNNPSPQLNQDFIDIHFIYIKKPAPMYNSERQCFKDGFHVLIPSIKITKQMKIFLLNKINEDEIFKDLFRQIPLCDKDFKNCLDMNSAHVPCFFLGSSSKIGTPPYYLHSVFKSVIYYDSMDNPDYLIMINKCEDLEKLNDRSDVVLSHEFSLNWESGHAIIKKRNYALREEYIKFLQKNPIVEEDKDEEFEIIESGELSLLKVHDPDTEYIISLLDTLDIKRAYNYNEWFKVICALAHTNKSYKPLGDYFSKKCPEKYNPADFEKYWNIALTSPGNKLTIGSLHYWAKNDNPNRYEEIRTRSVFDMAYRKVYDAQLEGNLQHYDIAQILHKSLKHKYVYDAGNWYEFIIDGDPQKDGEIYKWRKYEKGTPSSIKRYISEILPRLFNKVFNRIDTTIEDLKADDKANYHIMVKKNFKLSCRKLRDSGFKSGVCNEAAQLFERIGFEDKLDKDPEILGVGNGIIILGKETQFITGYHSYLVSSFTPVKYKEFNPYDELTKKVLIALRNMFADDEPDSFNFMMHYFASALDGKKKESLLVLLVGNGSNGKSFLMELIKGTIGEKYAVKMPLAFLTSRQSNSESATPALMSLVNARFAYYSETDKSEVLNCAKLKEVTGMETLGGRKNFGDYINFKPVCHHLVASNYDFEVTGNDHGIWRRLKRVAMKIKFCKKNTDYYDEKNPYERMGDPEMGANWPDNDDVKTAFLSVLTYYYESLQNNYEGIVENIPHPNIMKDTEEFRDSQDKINNFVNMRFVKTINPDVETSMEEIIEKYTKWYNSLYPDAKDYKKGLNIQFENSKLSKVIVKNRKGVFVRGYRVLDNKEDPEEGEKYFVDIFMEKTTNKKFVLEPETSEQYYNRICKDYDEITKIKVERRKVEAETSAKKKQAMIAALRKKELDNKKQNTKAPLEIIEEIKEEPEEKTEYDRDGFKIKKEKKKLFKKADFDCYTSDSSDSDLSFSE